METGQAQVPDLPEPDQGEKAKAWAPEMGQALAQAPAQALVPAIAEAPAQALVQAMA